MQLLVGTGRVDAIREDIFRRVISDAAADLVVAVERYC